MKHGVKELAKRVLEVPVSIMADAKHLVLSAIRIPRTPKGTLNIGPKGAEWGRFERPGAAANWPDDPDQKGLQEYDHVVEPYILSDRPVLLVSTRHQPVLELIRWFEDLGGEVATTTALDLALNAISESPANWGLFAVFMDGLEDTDGIVETLLLLRSIKPDLPVILISKDFVRNDYSTERMLICDVSLRAPIDQSALGNAVVQSIRNNNIFAQSRL